MTKVPGSHLTTSSFRLRAHNSGSPARLRARHRGARSLGPGGHRPGASRRPDGRKARCARPRALGRRTRASSELPAAAPDRGARFLKEISMKSHIFASILTNFSQNLSPQNPHKFLYRISRNVCLSTTVRQAASRQPTTHATTRRSAAGERLLGWPAAIFSCCRSAGPGEG